MANTIKVKRGTNLSNAGTPAAGELIYKTDTNALYVGDGTTAATGLTAITGGGSGAVDSISNFADNRVLTASDADSIRGEGNLTFDGTTLAVTGALTTSSTINIAGIATFQSHINMGDSDILRLGSDLDLKIQHTGSHGYITNDTGNLYIRGGADDSQIVLQADDGSGGLTDYIKINGSESLTRFKASTRHNDNIIAQFGSSNDFRLKHDGSNSYITNDTGNLFINQTTDDGDIILKSDDGSGGITAYLTLDGSSTRIKVDKDMEFQDSVYAKFGTSDDLEIYHNGTNSFGADNYTGALIFQQRADDEDIIFKCDDGSGGVATYLTLDGSAGYTTVQKTLRLDDDVQLHLGTGNDLKIYHNSSSANNNIDNHSGSLYVTNYVDDQDIIFRTDDGSGGVTAYLTLDGSIVRTVFDKATRHKDSVQGYFGNADDLRIEHDGTNTYIDNHTGNLVIQCDTDDGDVILKSDDGAGGLTGYLELDGSAKQIKLKEDIVVTATKKLYFDGGGNTYIMEDTADRLRFFTGGAEFMRFTEDTSNTLNLYQPMNFQGQTVTNAGEISATSLDISGDVDIDGTLETDALTINGTTSVAFTSSDHSKLDGIEASATADQSAAEILTAIKTVDGSGSGLDADTLDGFDSTRFFRRDGAATATVGPGWMTVATNTSGRRAGEILVTDADSGDHGFIRIHWLRSYQDSNFTVINCGGHNNRITGVRVLSEDSDNTYGEKVLQVYVTVSSSYDVKIFKMGDDAHYTTHTVHTPTIEDTISGFSVHGNALTDLNTYGFGHEEGIYAGLLKSAGNLTVNGSSDLTGRVTITDGGADGLLINNDTGNSADSSRIFFEGTSTTALMQQGNDFSIRSGATTGSSSGTERFYVNSSGATVVGDLAVTGNSVLQYGLVVNEGGHNADFRVEGDTQANLFKVDASEDKVGINEGSPSFRLDVNGDLRVVGNGDHMIRFTRSGADVISIEQDSSQLYFYNRTTSKVTFLMDEGGHARMGHCTNPIFEIRNEGTSAGHGGSLTFGHSQDSSTTAMARISGYLVDGSSAGRAGHLRFWTSRAGSDELAMQLQNDNKLRLYQPGDTSDYGEMYVDDDRVHFHAASGNYHRFTTDHGYIELGPANSGWGHINTDRDKFYFNKPITVDGGNIDTYDEDMHLRRAGSNDDKISIYASDTRIYGDADERMRIGSIVRCYKPFYVKTTSSSAEMRFYHEDGTGNIADSFADTTTDKSYINFQAGDSSNDPGYIMHETSDSETNEGVIHICPSDDNADSDYVSIHGTNDADKLKLHTSGRISGCSVIQVADGSAGTPSISNEDDNNTGMYFPAADNIGFSVNGGEVVRIDGSGLGVGITPAETLDLKTSSGDCRIRLDAPDGSDTEIKFFNAGSAVFTIGHDDGTGRFVIGTTNVDTAKVTFDTSGNLYATADVVAYASSDKRLKNNLKVIENPLDKVSKLSGYEFDWNDKQETYQGHDVGVVAQEVEKVMPEIVEDREDGYKAVKYEKLIPLLIESIKELKEEINGLKTKLGE